MADKQTTEWLFYKATITVALLGALFTAFGLISDIDEVFWSGAYVLFCDMCALTLLAVWEIWHV